MSRLFKVLLAFGWALIAHSAAVEAQACFTKPGIACETHDAIAKTAVLGARSAGCSRVNPFVSAQVLESRGPYVRIRTLPPFPELTLWMNADEVRCGPPPPEPAAPIPVDIDITADGFVWKKGERIGWVDLRVPAFYWMDQVEMEGGTSPTPKADARGWEVSRSLMKEDIADFVRNPEAHLKKTIPNPEVTADGFVWRSGTRVGWVRRSDHVYYPMNAIELSGELVLVKPGAQGVRVTEGNLAAAIEEAEKPDATK